MPQNRTKYCNLKIKKGQKFICLGVLILFLFCASFFYISTNKVSAAGLEVQYPTIANENPNTDTNLTLPKYVLYLFNGGMFLGFFAVFISLVIAGVMYFLSPVSAELRASAKDRVSGAISGLLILALTYLIVVTINPQLSVFNLNALSPTPLPPPVTKIAPGVYFYGVSSNNGGNNNEGGGFAGGGGSYGGGGAGGDWGDGSSGNCSDESVQPHTSSVPDLGPLKNKVNSVNIVQNADTGNSYISILYANPNFWGKCQYINPSGGCQSVPTFASSASVHVYDFHPADNNPIDGGVYFFRKSCFNDKAYSNATDLINHCEANSGGYYEVTNDEISPLYIGDLNQLKFRNVLPQEEQDCVKYDKNDACIGRAPQSLGGENTSSIIINGNYLVLLIYKATNDPTYGPWTSCQEFPTGNDVNKLGPRQIKWENIRNNNGVIPNYVLIIPIQS